jgi:nucleotide-binding universal stress UspA family protein
MKILAAIDFSPVTENVLATIERMAGTFPVEVWLVHVSPPDPAFVGYETGPDVVRSQVATEHRQRHQQLHQLADRLRAHQVGATALLLQGPTVETIVADTKRLGAELIVLGSHGHGAVYNMLVGSVAEGIVRASTVPVLLVPPSR